jgi:hypothetical protein
MKSGILFGMIGLIMSSFSYAQTADAKAVKKTIVAFSKAADQNDAVALSNCLDQHYRIVMNQLFGSKEVSVMSRHVYVEKIKNKEFGGDKREVTIEQLIVNGNTACAKVTFKGIKSTFVSLISLVKNSEGEWLLVGDMPIIK